MTRNLLSGFKGKRGFIGDVITIVVFLFIIGLVILCGKLVLNAFNTGLQNTPGIGDAGKTIISTQNEGYSSLWDGLFGVLLIGLSLAAVISAYFVDTHPILFPLTLILLAVFVIVSAAISNTWFAVESSTAFTDLSSQFRLMSYVLNHLGTYVLLEGALIVIALFTKARQ